MTLGIDISKYQPKTPPLAGLDFLIAKVTEGTTRDPLYPTHIANARKAGLVTGAYHFNYGPGSIAAQVRAFLAAAGEVDLYAVDVEGGNAFTHAQTAEFIKGVQAAGKQCGLYHSESGFFDAGQDWNWIANWSKMPSRHWDFWQYRGSPLDLDRFNGTPEALRAFVGKGVDVAGIAYEFDSTAKAGRFVVSGDGHSYLELATGTLKPITSGSAHDAFGPVTLVGRGITGPTDTRKVGYVIGKRAAFMIPADGTFTPTASDDGFTKATQDAAVAAQKAADQVVIDVAKLAATAATDAEKLRLRKLLGL